MQGPTGLWGARGVLWRTAGLGAILRYANHSFIFLMELPLTNTYQGLAIKTVCPQTAQGMLGVYTETDSNNTTQQVHITDVYRVV